MLYQSKFVDKPGKRRNRQVEFGPRAPYRFPDAFPSETLVIASLLVAKCMPSPIMQSTVNGILSQTSSLSLLNKSVAAIIGIAAIYLTFRVLERTLPQRFGQGDVRYRVRKFIVFCGYVTA